MAANVKKVKAEVSSIPKDPESSTQLPDIDAEIAERAYYKAENRGFAPGHELDDWLEAERENNVA